MTYSAPPATRKRSCISKTSIDQADGDEQVNAFSRAEWNERNPGGLKSLVLPWALLAIVAVGITAKHTRYLSHDTHEYDVGNLAMESDGSPSFGSLVIRTLKSYGTEHAPLFPLTSSDYTGFAFATVGLMIAAGGGIGGGGILVPIYILVMGFHPKQAIPLSNITVFGGAVANGVLNWPKRHPLANRPLVDWDLILVMEPLTIAGALVGAFLNKLLPEVLLVALLVALLSFTAYKSLTKGVKMYKIETRRMQEKESELVQIVHQEEEMDEDESLEKLLSDVEFQEGESPGSGEDSGEGSTILEGHEQLNEELAQILEEESVPPPGNITMLVVMFIAVLFINIMKGGGAFPSPLGIECGSQSFWIANAVMLIWIVVISLMAREYLVRRFERKQKCGYKYVEGDIQWDAQATLVYPVICMLAGFFAGMFGIGGGIVKGPLMLQMGVHPAVSSASSAVMIFFTSFTATTSFIAFGLLTADYAKICFSLGFCATLVGQIGLGMLMKKSNRNSYIVFSIGGVVLISAFLMTIQSLVAMAEGTNHQSSSICG